MNTQESFMGRLLRERDDLERKLNQLNGFIATEKFNAIDSVQQGLLLVQAGQMAGYLNTLNVRIGLLEPVPNPAST